ncbi:diphosphomevalonate/mevalonate 3,5-bisphosphate decarboxylase family protein [Flavobacterium sp. ASW18X]|uniref:diphosphomevalonate/mevalonate 3,5-bisphosphate decarboxylase family protein n=1 Tax=Flavobacterium sp. ASW18X TaxID=2572595 RepID=UPI0010ADEF4A|nr:diphosphomevalonate decarboxylase [Flavobacterium sp. ASW18X]TKD63637.1 diphosphomevalonate decarboxylase [Flavobacterium sp. ASW18X]
MTEKDFIPQSNISYPKEGRIGYKAPSNIALVKYWGKKENQIPANPSVSFTLDACATRTVVTFKEKTPADEFSFDLLFEGKPKEDFKPKIETFFNRVAVYLPYLKKYHFTIDTSNSFPHSSGIASSASGMAALALCLLEIEKMADATKDDSYFDKKASFLARLGSGSACRSIKGSLVQWGKHSGLERSTNLFGVPYPHKVHEVFKTYHDTILLVHKGQKTVSSTVGHNLMNGHPYAKSRFVHAHTNLDALEAVFASGDLEKFIGIVESEALTLHAMMMSSTPYFILMMPNTLQIINAIWDYRKTTGTPICFTLDAGANVHVLYPEDYKEQSIAFIQEQLVQYCENGHYICDKVGQGAKKLNLK